MKNEVIVYVRRLTGGDTPLALCGCIRLDSSIKTFYLPKSLITYTDNDDLETFVLMPLWLAKRHNIDQFAIKDMETKS